MAFWAMSHTVWGNVALSKYGVSSVSPGIQITLSHPKQPPPESRDAAFPAAPSRFGRDPGNGPVGSKYCKRPEYKSYGDRQSLAESLGLFQNMASRALSYIQHAACRPRSALDIRDETLHSFFPPKPRILSRFSPIFSSC